MQDLWGRDPSLAVAAQAPQMATSLSYLRPKTPMGEDYTPSYTRYLNAPGSSYVHPLHRLYNDRRPQAPKIRTTLAQPRSRRQEM